MINLKKNLAKIELTTHGSAINPHYRFLYRAKNASEYNQGISQYLTVALSTEEPHDNHKTPGRQKTYSNHLRWLQNLKTSNPQNMEQTQNQQH